MTRQYLVGLGETMLRGDKCHGGEVGVGVASFALVVSIRG